MTQVSKGKYFHTQLRLVPLNTSGLRITTSGDACQGCVYSATCSTTVTAGVGATFEHELFWTYNSSKVVNTSNITVTEEAHGDILSVTMEFETLLTQHTGLYQCRVVFSPSNGPTVFDSVADFNIIVREQSKSWLHAKV